jgi:hypothetical protein
MRGDLIAVGVEQGLIFHMAALGNGSGSGGSIGFRDRVNGCGAYRKADDSRCDASGAFAAQTAEIANPAMLAPSARMKTAAAHFSLAMDGLLLFRESRSDERR